MMDLSRKNISGNHLDDFEVLLWNSRYARLGVAVFILAASITATVGHLLMLFTFAKHCRGDQRKKYLFGLHFAALIIALTYYPLFVLELLRPDLILANGCLCILTKCAKIFASLFYLFSILTVSCWNYVFFLYPLRGRLWIQTRNVVVVWFTGFILCLVLTTVAHFASLPQHGRGHDQLDHFSCWDIKDMKLFVKVTFVTIATSGTILTLFLNGSVFRLATKMERAKKSGYLTCRDKANPSSHHLQDSHSGRTRACVAVVIFLFLWLPFWCTAILRLFCKSCINLIVLLVIGDLSFFSGSFAPIVMFLITEKYRYALMCVVTCRRRSQQRRWDISSSLPRSFHIGAGVTQIE